MERVVIDTDPGVDDAHAILMAFSQPETRVEALTTVAGNVSLERATANALTLLDLVGQDTPVYPGCADALVVPTPHRATSHGADGLGDSGYPPSTRRAENEHAVQALIRLASEAEGELTLIALGPLTNLALASKLDPALPRKYKRLIVMGGAINATGNSWTPAAEFNMYVDPEAAAVVFQNWPGLTLVSWETTMRHALEPRQVDELCRIDSPYAEFFRRSIKNRYLNQLPGWKVLFEADPLAMAVALVPDIVLRSELRFVEVELGGRSTRGQTVVDWFDLNGRLPNAHLVQEIDKERFWELMKQSLMMNGATSPGSHPER